MSLNISSTAAFCSTCCATLWPPCEASRRLASLRFEWRVIGRARKTGRGRRGPRLPLSPATGFAGDDSGKSDMARRRIVCALVAVWSSTTVWGPAHAQTRAVVELFTSQGCSSCPPADKLLGDLASDPSLVTISIPIDYWDYLGWKDTLAEP